MPRRNRVIRRERELVAVSNRSVHIDATDRVGPVQNKHRDLSLRGLFEQVTERRAVSPEAHADVLNVVDERVEIFELLGLGPARLAVERIDWKSSRFILRIG